MEIAKPYSQLSVAACLYLMSYAADLLTSLNPTFRSSLGSSALWLRKAFFTRGVSLCVDKTFCAQRYSCTYSEVLRGHVKAMVEAFVINLMVENELWLAIF